MPRDNELRTTFDTAAAGYQSARPDYPEALYRDLQDITGIKPPDRLLEIGCGSGKATLPLATSGFTITCIELGPGLAAVARQNLVEFPGVQVLNTSFEAWNPGPTQFDLAYAATSWHWIDRDLRYARTADHLRPGGHLAIWGASHAFPSGFDPFFTEIQSVYDEIGESYPGDWPPPPPHTWPDARAELESSGRFTAVGTRRYVWPLRYDVDQYIALLNTFSNHIAMEPARRRHLYREIRRRFAARPDGKVTRHWGTVLTIGRRT